MNRISELASFIENCKVVYDVGSDHALLAINLLKAKKVKLVANIEKNLRPYQSGLARLAKAHLTTKTLNVLHDGLENITKKITEQPNYVCIAGMGALSIINILEKKDNRLDKNCKYILQPNCDTNTLRKWLTKNNWNILQEKTCLEKNNKFYQIILAIESNKQQKLNNFDIYFGKFTSQNDKETWKKYLQFMKDKIKKDKLNKVSQQFDQLYKSIDDFLKNNEN